MKIISTNSFSQCALLLKVVVISNVFLPSVVYAYIDPGSGGVIVTTLLGFAAAVGYTFRKYFYKLKRAIFGEKQQDQQERLKDKEKAEDD